MRLPDPSAEGARVLAVCNACRYCEQYCPVFQAMERRLAFASADVNYLANLCHNCGECLYACQYAPPHEFAINVPQALARARVQSYERHAWPAPLGKAFRRQGVTTALALAAAMIVVLFAATLVSNPAALRDAGSLADFYAVLPHGAMVALFGGVGAFVVVALAVGARRFARDAARSHAMHAEVDWHGTARARATAMHDVLTLRHLHASGEPCTTAEEVRTPWRRRFHHATFYGFALCFASTSVAALYHAFGREAPYDYASLPVLLGTLGGLGLVAGPLGLLLQRRSRDPALTDAAQEALDRAFLVLLLLTGASGLALLALRHQPAMGVLLLAHLGLVLALFVTLPYGKFVHGIYRALALAKYAREGELH
jgi:citrate/tricarballylate utilization protein